MNKASNSAAKVFAVVCLIIMAFPSHAYKFIVDPKGVNMKQFEQDVRDCEALSQQQSIAEEAAIGALAGATLGVIAGDNSDWARGGAAVGAANGAWSGYRTKRGVVRNCLTGRGYRILN